MKTVYPDENNVVLNEKSVEGKPCINREIKSDELTIWLYSCHNINMNFLAVVTPRLFIMVATLGRRYGRKISQVRKICLCL